MTYLAAQVIEIEYGKGARGGVGAAARARVAEAMPLPPGGDDGGVLHRCSMSVWTGLVPSETTSVVSWRDGELAIDRFRIRIEGDALAIRNDPGAEVWKTRALAQVPTGAWARVRWNQIRRSYDERWFSEHVMNIGLFERAPARGVFFGEPTTTIDLRRDLLWNGSRAE